MVRVKLACGLALLSLVTLPPGMPAQVAAQPHTQETPLTHHAHGTFEVKMQPLTPAPAESLSRMSIDKQLHGDLEASSKGEMIAGGDFRTGSAGYVAMELVTGTLDGKTGSFALQHSATMDPSGQKMQILVVPGSGTGALKGLTGTFTIVIANGQHSYDFDYSLPPTP